MKDFKDMTVAEMEKFIRSRKPIYSFSFVAVKNKRKVVYDGDHTTPEHRDATCEHILKELIRGGWGIQHEMIEKFVRSRNETVKSL